MIKTAWRVPYRKSSQAKPNWIGLMVYLYTLFTLKPSKHQYISFQEQHSYKAISAERHTFCTLILFNLVPKSQRSYRLMRSNNPNVLKKWLLNNKAAFVLRFETSRDDQIRRDKESFFPPRSVLRTLF
ncbi:hypothetical protein NPIL_469811 [Nephila pilipes]|uniref:Uncharacterized protein n=1 Tax=Nephila pilipes TaxID=299642 RepID=A0A8X6NFV5_NEPPI|nr:hypothetical protein NPIL_469811 [Nephila pilipes]